MKISSFDIFDTCFIRKCGDPQNLLDILAWHAFNEEVSDTTRKEFIMARRMADLSTYDNPYAKLSDIYETIQYSHPLLKDKAQLIKLEYDLERQMLVPIPKMLDMVTRLRKDGCRIVFISDMYLSADFLASVLAEAGLMQDGDKLYVSCEVGKRKADGTMFKYIQTKEHIKYRDWIHYGDNIKSDYQVPRSLGITAKRVEWRYTPYQNAWYTKSYAPGNRIAETLAGICRCLHHTLPGSPHKDFLLDLAAPMFVAFTYRVIHKAQGEGIKRLYFCARDAKLCFLIAELLNPLFPGLSVHYLYISRDALYKGNPTARMKYFEQCGLASKTEKCAIVDLRTTGKTLMSLNELLHEAGFQQVSGFFFEMFCTRKMDYIPSNYYAELLSPYYSQKPSCLPAYAHYNLIEKYISLHNEARTIDYVVVDGKASPKFADKQTEAPDENAIIHNVEQRCAEHREIVLAFTRLFVESELYRSADAVFEVAIRTWMNFTKYPERYYLSALVDFYTCKPQTDIMLPYVQKMGILELLRTRGNNTIWHQASIVYSLSPWLGEVYKKKKC